jgi:hypothetical protein
MRPARSLAMVCGLGALSAILVTGLATGCTTTGKSYLPIDSQLRPWQPPENGTPAPSAAAAPTPSGQAEKGEKKGKK